MSEVVDRKIGPLTVLFGVENGKYPHGNSLLVEGQNKRVLIDPSRALWPGPTTYRKWIKSC